MKRKVYANAVLKDGKLIFWYMGGECRDLGEFSKDFYYSGLNTANELKNHNYELKSKQVSGFDDTGFFRQFELHEDFKGRKPY